MAVTVGISFLRQERLVPGIGGALAFVALWQLGSSAGVLNPIIFSSPGDVLRQAGIEFSHERIWIDLATSLGELVLGVAVASVVGVAIGSLVGWSRRARYALDPWITVLYSTPKVALVPLVILVLGIDLGAKVFIVALMCVFSVIVNTTVGVQTARGQLLTVARAFGASGLMQWRSVVIPTSVPFVLTGLRLALGQGMIGVIVAELIAGEHGLGALLRYAAFSLQSGLVMLALLLIGVWGLLSGEVMRRIEGRMEVWRPSDRT